MLVKVWGYRVSTVNSGWFGLLLSAMVIFPCIIGLQFSDVITRRIINYCQSYDNVLADLTAACKMAIMVALLNLMFCGFFILELERYIFPAKTAGTRLYKIVWIYSIPYERPAVSKSDNKPGSKPKMEEV